MMPLALVRLTAHGQREAQGGGTPAWDMGGQPGKLCQAQEYTLHDLT